MKTVDKEKLWEAYRKKPSQELREQLIIEYSQLVKLVAGRLSMYLGYNVEYGSYLCITRNFQYHGHTTPRLIIDYKMKGWWITWQTMMNLLTVYTRTC